MEPKLEMILVSKSSQLNAEQQTPSAIVMLKDKLRRVLLFVSEEFAPPIAFRPTVGAVLMREGEEEDKIHDANS